MLLNRATSSQISWPKSWEIPRGRGNTPVAPQVFSPLSRFDLHHWHLPSRLQHPRRHRSRAGPNPCLSAVRDDLLWNPRWWESPNCGKPNAINGHLPWLGDGWNPNLLCWLWGCANGIGFTWLYHINQVSLDVTITRSGSKGYKSLGSMYILYCLYLCIHNYIMRIRIYIYIQ